MNMKRWIILDYGNGNKVIMEKSEYEKAQREEYGVDATTEGYYDEAVVGIVESEHEPDWNDFEYDEETGEYVLREDLDAR